MSGLALPAWRQQKASPFSGQEQQAGCKAAAQRTRQPLLTGAVAGVRPPGVAAGQPRRGSQSLLYSHSDGGNQRAEKPHPLWAVSAVGPAGGGGGGMCARRRTYWCHCVPSCVCANQASRGNILLFILPVPLSGFHPESQKVVWAGDDCQLVNTGTKPSGQQKRLILSTTSTLSVKEFVHVSYKRKI